MSLQIILLLTFYLTCTLAGITLRQQTASGASTRSTVVRHDSTDKAKASKLIAGNNTFAFVLYQQMATGKENMFFSPFSLSTALAMTYAGARNETAAQMANTLKLNSASAEVHSGFKNLLEDIKRRNQEGVQLKVANALWAQPELSFHRQFLSLIQTNYQGGLKKTNFMNAPEESRLTINAWVEKETSGKIKDLLTPGTITINTRLVLTNAIYYKGSWAKPFEKESTRKDLFYQSSSKKDSAFFMHQGGMFTYYQNKEVQLLELPYTGNKVSMVVLLPKSQNGLASLEKKLTYAQYLRWQAAMVPEQVSVALPRFTMTSTFAMKEVLSQLGMPIAFSPQADFSGMSSQATLNISGVIHKAFVDVNEKGTEAAAATAVTMDTESIPQYKHFKADHPFLFLIIDKPSQSILFMGKVVDPT